MRLLNIFLACIISSAPVYGDEKKILVPADECPPVASIPHDIMSWCDPPPRRAIKACQVYAIDDGDTITYMTKDQYDRTTLEVELRASLWSGSYFRVNNLHALSAKFAERWHIK
jgi:hypothetical protein